MSLYKKKNNVRTISTSAISALATSIGVEDISVFPSEFPFVVTIWDKETYLDPTDDPDLEVVVVTNISGNNIIVTRGQEDTSATAHPSGSAIEMLITAGIFTNIEDQFYPYISNWNSAYSNMVSNWRNGLIFASGIVDIDYNTTNLRITTDKLNTIQDIATTSTPTFGNLTINGNITVSGTVDGKDISSFNTSGWDSASTFKATLDLINGLILCDGLGNYSALTNNSSNWNDAYSKRVDTWGDGINLTSNIASIDYNTTNLKITSAKINTIQDIASSSSPTFSGLTLNGNLTITGTVDGKDISEFNTSGWDGAVTLTGTLNALNGIIKCNGLGVYSVITDNSGNWNTSYGWGNHASAGYLTAESDTLNTVTGRGATTANNITVGNLNASNVQTGTSLFIGDSVTNGSWKMEISGTDLLIYKRESGTWNEKGRFTP